MRYWQITTRRLSKAAAKLDMDGEWHPFSSTPQAWYRVWKKKLVQRVNFEDAEEEEALLSLVMSIEPLPELATVSGFREELNIRRSGEEYRLILPVGLEPQNLASIQRILEPFGISTRTSDGLLYAMLPLRSFERQELASAQTNLTAVRLFFQAAVINSDPHTLEAAADGFQRMMASGESG